MITGAPPGTLGLANPSGWMTAELFPEVLDHFIRHTSSSKNNPSLLIYDNHESHITLKIVNAARDNGVTILTLPPHCSNKMQPLDVGVFGPFKAYYYSAIDSWLLNNPGIPITIYQLAECVGVAYGRAFTPANIISGFAKTGIFPFDDKIFTDADFLSSAVTDRNDNKEEQEGQVPKHIDAENEIETEVKDDFVNQEINLHQSTSTNDFIVTTSSTSSEGIIQPGCSAPKTFVSPEMIRGYPKAKPRKLTRKNRKKGSSTVITSTPEKQALEEKEIDRAKIGQKTKIKELQSEVKINEMKCKRSKKIKLDKESVHSSEDEDDFIGDDSSEGEFITEDPEIDYEKKPQKDDFVLVSFPGNVYYIGKIISDIDNDGDFVISYLRKSEKYGGCFIYPNNPDIHSVNQKDIVITLPAPSHAPSKRLSNLIRFAISLGNYHVR